MRFLAAQEEGKYNTTTSKYVMGLAEVLVEQGRYAEAEKLTRVALEINRVVGVALTRSRLRMCCRSWAVSLNLQRKSTEGWRILRRARQGYCKWTPQRRQIFELNGSRIYALYSSGQVEAGLTAAQALLKREISRVGEAFRYGGSARHGRYWRPVRANKRAARNS